MRKSKPIDPLEKRVEELEREVEAPKARPIVVAPVIYPYQLTPVDQPWWWQRPFWYGDTISRVPPTFTITCGNTATSSLPSNTTEAKWESMS